MKTKIILLQVFFLISIFCIRKFINIQDTKEILGVVLLVGLSFGMCRYILKSKKMFCVSLWMGFSLFLLFEVSNLIEYLLGFLPRYNDVPQIIRLPLVLVAILVYMLALYLICLYLRMRKRKRTEKLDLSSP